MSSSDNTDCTKLLIERFNRSIENYTENIGKIPFVPYMCPLSEDNILSK